MCEQSEPPYKHEDIVWVKLGGKDWWPGEVKDLEHLPEDVLKDIKKSRGKQPLAIVKFFTEDSYEFVKNLDQIYFYNCGRKNEFIKKGLEMKRVDQSYQEQFRNDVCSAEIKTGGDPHILNDPIFAPEEKIVIDTAAIFGTPPGTKQRKSKTPGGSGRKQSKKTDSSSSKNQPHITHPRFLGHNDHMTFIMIQGKPKEVEKTKQEEGGGYMCRNCSFETRRIELLILHNKGHMAGTIKASPTKGKKKTPKVSKVSKPVVEVKKRTKPKGTIRMSASKTSTIEEDLLLIDEGVTFDSSSTEEEEEFEEPKPKKKRKPLVKKSKQPPTIPQGNSIQIIARDWDDTDEEVEQLSTSTSGPTQVHSSVSSTPSSSPQKPKVDLVKSPTTTKVTGSEETTDKEEHDLEKSNSGSDIESSSDIQKSVDLTSSPEKDTSCFEFEDEDYNMDKIEKIIGRKIPRVVPQIEIAPPAGDKTETSVESGGGANTGEESNSSAPDSNVFKDLLESTAMPTLPDVPNTLKCEQNFHSAKTIKFPDKPEGDESPEEPVTKSVTTTASESTAVSDSAEASEPPEASEPADVSESTEASVSTEVNVSTNPGGKSTELMGSAEVTETAEPCKKEDTPKKKDLDPKPINPKKRLVKSYENSEMELQKKMEKENEAVIASNVEVSKLKNRLMNKLTVTTERSIPVQKQEETHKSPEKPSAKQQSITDHIQKLPKVEAKPEPPKSLVVVPKPVVKPVALYKSFSVFSRRKKTIKAAPIVEPKASDKPFLIQAPKSRPVYDLKFTPNRNRRDSRRSFSDRGMDSGSESGSIYKRTRRTLSKEEDKPEISLQNNFIVAASEIQSSSTLHLDNELKPVESLELNVPIFEERVGSKRNKTDVAAHGLPRVAEHSSSSLSATQLANIIGIRGDEMVENDSHKSDFNGDQETNTDPTAESITEDSNDITSSLEDLVKTSTGAFEDTVVITIEEVPTVESKEVQKVDAEDCPNTYVCKGTTAFHVDETPLHVEEVPTSAETPRPIVDQTAEAVTEVLSISVTKVDDDVTFTLVSETPKVDEATEPAIQEATIVSIPEDTETSSSTDELMPPPKVEKVLPHIDHVAEEIIMNTVEQMPTIVVEEIPAVVAREIPTTVIEEASSASVVKVSTAIVEDVPTTIVGEVPTTVVEEVSTTIVEEVPATMVEEVPASMVEEVATTIIEEVPTTMVEEVPATMVEELSTTIVEEVPTAIVEEVPTSIVEEVPTTVGEQIPTTTVEQIPRSVKDVPMTVIQQVPSIFMDDSSSNNTDVKTSTEETIWDLRQQFGSVQDTKLEVSQQAPQELNLVLPKRSPTLPEPTVSDFLSKSESIDDGLSALSTLAAVSANADRQDSPFCPTSKAIDYTVVSEHELADGQVEIADVKDESAAPVTLTNFSVDFMEDSSEPKAVAEVSADSVCKKKVISSKMTSVYKESPLVPTTVPSYSTYLKTKARDVKANDTKGKISADGIESELTKFTNLMNTDPDRPKIADEATSSSKLLEILTDSKPTSPAHDGTLTHQQPAFSSSSMKKIDSKTPIKLNRRYDFKTKHMIKSLPGPTSPVLVPQPPAPPPKVTKPIILSEKIIKPVSQPTTNVHVQRVTGKRDYEDIEDIDTFIIQKPVKKFAASEPDPDLEFPQKQMYTTPTQPNSESYNVYKTKSRGSKARPKTTLSQPSRLPPASTSSTSTSSDIFDISSMPIVMEDQIIPAETTDLPTTSTQLLNTTASQPVKMLNKCASMATSSSLKLYSTPKMVKATPQQRVYQAVPKQLPKTPSTVHDGTRFMIVASQASAQTRSTPAKYTPGRKTPVLKRPVTPQIGTTAKLQSIHSGESVGNKLMIMTDPQGHQTRVLVSTANQKAISSSSPTLGSKTIKSNLKSSILQKNSAKQIPMSARGQTMLPQTTYINSKGEVIGTSQNILNSEGQLLMPLKQSQLQIRNAKPNKKYQVLPNSQRLAAVEGLGTYQKVSTTPQQKTIVFKNQQGQIVKKIQGTDDALLEQQVAEQVEAIKASGSFNAMKGKTDFPAANYKTKIPKKSYQKKPVAAESERASKTQQMQQQQILLNTAAPAAAALPAQLQKQDATAVPPLAPISTAKPDLVLQKQQQQPQQQQPVVSAKEEVKPAETATEASAAQKPLHQLILQDSQGNQTMITEGQIVAIPTEATDGQPQSYMLVTLDETGNLVPLNDDALHSLDSNLNLGGDLSNMVLQFNDGSTASAGTLKETAAAEPPKPAVAIPPIETPISQEQIVVSKEEPETAKLPHVISQEEVVMEQPTVPTPEVITESSKTTIETNLETEESKSQLATTAQEQVQINIGSESNQQLLITGDPISTQKFLESLTEANPDLANLLANAEGNILIQTDGQNILINTDSENQILLSTSGMAMADSTETTSNSLFASPPKNQDILAAALANTDVFQQEHPATTQLVKSIPSQLSPSTTLYPNTVTNILDTTLSLSSPIMTPLEVPSTNCKKIPDEESDILTTEVPKNIDLPITITDPNISQTVAQQQVASMIANELSTPLDLPLSITEHVTAQTPSDLNSPSYVFSLPSLEEQVDTQKSFSGPISMPLLTEDPQEAQEAEVERASITNLETADVGDKEKNEDVPENVGESSPIRTESIAVEAYTTAAQLTDGFQAIMMEGVDSEEGLCMLGAPLCNSLSEPPPDMFDISEIDFSAKQRKGDILNGTPTNSDGTDIETHEVESQNKESETSSSPELNTDENSCEIPVQPQIVTTSFDLQESSDECVDFSTSKRGSADEFSSDKKKMKFFD